MNLRAQVFVWTSVSISPEQGAKSRITVRLFEELTDRLQAAAPFPSHLHAGGSLSPHPHPHLLSELIPAMPLVGVMLTSQLYKKGMGD